MSKRITVTLPDTIYLELSEWSKKRGQSVAPAAAVAIELLLASERSRVIDNETTNEGD